MVRSATASPRPSLRRSVSRRRGSGETRPIVSRPLHIPRFHRLAGQRSRAPGAACHARARVALILAPESAVDRFAREHPTQLGLTLRASTPRYHCCVVADEIDIPAAPKAPRNSAAGSAVCDGPCAAHSARDQWGHAKPRVSRRE